MRNGYRFGLVASALVATMHTAAVLGQSQSAPADYPSRMVRIVAPQPPGSGVDTYVRAIAQKLTEAWGQQVIVDNRPGAICTRAD